MRRRVSAHRGGGEEVASGTGCSARPARPAGRAADLRVRTAAPPPRAYARRPLTADPAAAPPSDDVEVSQGAARDDGRQGRQGRAGPAGFGPLQVRCRTVRLGRATLARSNPESPTAAPNPRPTRMSARVSAGATPAVSLDRADSCARLTRRWVQTRSRPDGRPPNAASPAASFTGGERSSPPRLRAGDRSMFFLPRPRRLHRSAQPEHPRGAHPRAHHLQGEPRAARNRTRPHCAQSHTSPIHTSPNHISPIHTSPIHTSPMNTSPVHTSPIHTSPIHTSPIHTSPMRA